jgi:hypothetical protein
MGFVFVTEEGGKPLLFANGSRGREIAPWIKRHGYVFELYADDQRQILLAKLTVSGSGEVGVFAAPAVVGSCCPLRADHRISSGFVLCGLSQFDWTRANDISD